MIKQRLSNVQAAFLCVLVAYGCIWGAFVLLAWGAYGEPLVCVFVTWGAFVEGNAESKVEGSAGGNAEGNAKVNAKGLTMVSTPARGVMQ